MTYLNGFIVASLCVASFIQGVYIGEAREREVEKPFPLRAIQATCTKTNDCTIILYEDRPKIESVPSGKDQTPKKAEIVIVRK